MLGESYGESLLVADCQLDFHRGRLCRICVPVPATQRVAVLARLCRDWGEPSTAGLWIDPMVTAELKENELIVYVETPLSELPHFVKEGMSLAEVRSLQPVSMLGSELGGYAHESYYCSGPDVTLRYSADGETVTIDLYQGRVVRTSYFSSR